MRGKIGNLDFYERNGEAFVKKSASTSKAQRKQPNFRRSTENEREFGAAAAAGAALRDGLSGVSKAYADNELSNRLTALFRKMLKRGTGIRGKRPIEVSANPGMLRGLELNRKISLSSVFNASGHSVTVPASRDEATWDIPAFDPDTYITWPQGATHFKFTLAISVLSDYEYDPAAEDYVAIDSGINCRGTVVRSPDYALDVPLAAPVSITASLPAGTVLTAASSLIVCQGIEFYQEVSAQLYILASGNAMRIHDLY